MMAGAPEPHTSVLDSAMMEVDPKDGPSLTYQPQADLEPAETLTELKPVKQNVTYDSQTGKMYAELGSSNSNNSRPENVVSTCSSSSSLS